MYLSDLIVRDGIAIGMAHFSQLSTQEDISVPNFPGSSENAKSMLSLRHEYSFIRVFLEIFLTGIMD